jgi:hypothetical protein
MQRKWYRSVLEKDIDAVNGTPGSFRRHLSHLIFSCRSDWEEGGQDASDEYGHAGGLVIALRVRFC